MFNNFKFQKIKNNKILKQINNQYKIKYNDLMFILSKFILRNCIIFIK